MTEAEHDEQDRQQHERRDLDDVDDDGGHRRSADASIGDVAGHEGEHDADPGELAVVQHLAVGEAGVDVPEQGAGEGHHDAGVDPVVEVADPTHRQLGHPGPLAVVRPFLVEQRRLGEEVARPGAGVGIDPGQLAVAVGRQERQHQREQQAGPHRARRRYRAVGLGQCRLDLEGRPEERARRDQRHGVHGDAGEGETLLHLHRLCSCCHRSPFGVPPGQGRGGRVRDRGMEQVGADLSPNL